MCFRPFLLTASMCQVWSFNSGTLAASRTACILVPYSSYSYASYTVNLPQHDSGISYSACKYYAFRFRCQAQDVQETPSAVRVERLLGDAELCLSPNAADTQLGVFWFCTCLKKTLASSAPPSNVNDVLLLARAVDAEGSKRLDRKDSRRPSGTRHLCFGADAYQLQPIMCSTQSQVSLLSTSRYVKEVEMYFRGGSGKDGSSFGHDWSFAAVK